METPLDIIGTQMDTLFNAGKSRAEEIRLEVCDKCGKKVSQFATSVDDESVYCFPCVDEVNAMCERND